MGRANLIEAGALQAAGQEMHSLIERLYPICRSITGAGLRQTLRIVNEYVPLEMHEVPSGTQVFDWTVPKEWNIRDASIKGPGGEKIVDFGRSNLHILNYSIPVRATMPLRELKEHLFSLPDHPDWIPYRTSYYKEQWGFCLRHSTLQALQEGMYEVVVDSTLENGSLTYGELFLKGRTDDEVLISSHCCHPSLANDNLSGVSLAVQLAKHMMRTSNRLSYRFLFIPGTIGAITWLARNEDKLKNIKHGLVLAGVGNRGGLTYKKSRRGDAEIDRAASHVLKHAGAGHQVIDFYPYGYDERQYCSPGFNLPVGRISRTPYRQYPEYHTSADDLNFVQPVMLADTFVHVVGALEILEADRTYLSANQKCEPQLGKRGLYDAAGVDETSILWVLNLSDGQHSLLDIAERSGLPFQKIARAGGLLRDSGLLRNVARAV